MERDVKAVSVAEKREDKIKRRNRAINVMIIGGGHQVQGKGRRPYWEV